MKLPDCPEQQHKYQYRYNHNLFHKNNVLIENIFMDHQLLNLINLYISWWIFWSM